MSQIIVGVDNVIARLIFSLGWVVGWYWQYWYFVVCIILPSELDLSKSARSVVRVPGNEAAGHSASGAGAAICAPHGAWGPGPPGAPRAARGSHLLTVASAAPELSGRGAPLYIAPALRRVRLMATSCVLRVVIAPVMTSASTRSLNTRPVSQYQARIKCEPRHPGARVLTPRARTRLSTTTLSTQLSQHRSYSTVCHSLHHLHYLALSWCELLAHWKWAETCNHYTITTVTLVFINY